MIDRIRTEQTYQQISALRSLPLPRAVTYKERDSFTGQRVLVGADGGTLRANYLSENEPQSVPLYIPGTGNQPGFITNR